MDIRIQVHYAVIFILCFTIILLLRKIKKLKDKIPSDVKDLRHMRLDKALVKLQKQGLTLVAVDLKKPIDYSKNNYIVED